MARKIRAGDAKLMSRTAREALKPSGKPYYRLIERGVALGYRKPKKGPGTWLVRRYVGDDSYTVRNLTTADGHPVFADDHEHANGATVLDFGQAQDAIRAHKNEIKGAGPHTVANALDDYFRLLKNDGRSDHAIRDARYRADALILPKLGSVKVAALTSDRLRRWRDELVSLPPRLRTRDGGEQKYRQIDSSENARRARRASANRTWTILRAALNQSFTEGKAESDSAWRKVKPFKKVDAARIRYLTIPEAIRLINASAPEFRPLVQVALQTGCRYGELVRLEVRDFNSDAGTLAIRQSKSGHARHVFLTDEGQRLLASLTAGRSGHELILHKAGEPWRAAHQKRPMQEACAHAKIMPPINFHGLRHTWASLAVMNGVPLMVVARNLGHVDTRMVEKHYGHLAPSYVADAIRKSAPKFGFKAGNIKPLSV